MKIILIEEYPGCMRGRTMYVVPFYLETSTDGGRPMLGAQITDSAYVVVAMHLTSSYSDMEGVATSGDGVDFARCPHSVGAPCRAGQTCRSHATTPSTSPSSPETRTIWSYCSGPPGNPLLGDELDLSSVPFNRSGNGDTPAVTAPARQPGIASVESWSTRAPRHRAPSPSCGT